MDLRYAGRSLRQRGNRGFVAVAVFTLALGIGAATSIFSVGHGFLAEAFPFKDLDGIWQPWINFPPQATNNITRVPRNFSTELAKLPAIAAVMESVQALGTAALFVEGPYQLDPYPTFLISPNGFGFLGVPPLMGRTINAADVGENGAPADVVVLSYGGWKRFFPDDPNPVGKTVAFKNAQGEARTKTVIGVMPERFSSPSNYDIGNSAWTPLPAPRFDVASGTMAVRPRVRLKPGISKTTAEQQVHTLFTELAKAAPPTSQFFLADASGARTPREVKVTLRDFVSSTFDSQGVMRDNIKYLSIAVGLLLLIACMNVANLQLARAAARSKEIAVRLALGAGRRRLIRQLVTENVVLALIGAAVGILLAYGFTKGALAMLPSNTFAGAPLPESARVGINGPVLGFAVVIAIASGVLFGLAPAIQATRPDLNDALKDGGRGSAGSHGAKVRAVLVIAEVAFSTVLLVVASVTLWGYVRLVRIDPGFNPDGFYIMQPGMPATDGRASQLLERTKAMPFVESAARALIGQQSRYTAEGRPKDDTKNVVIALVDSEFMSTAGLRLIRGRNFEPGEITSAAPVVMVSSAAAALWGAGVDPIGKRITVDNLAPAAPPAPRGSPPNPASPPPTLTVIGIVPNIRRDVTQDVQPMIFVPYLLRPAGAAFGVRLKPGATPALQMEMQKMSVTVDKNVRINMQDIAVQFDQQFALPRFNFTLFCSLAVIALVLAVAGIYSVLSYHIVQRTREFGVRLALGADRPAILGLVLRAGGRLVGFGLIAGIAGSLATSRVVESQTVIFRVNFSDPTTLALAFGAIALLSLAATIACLVPARRATLVDPLTALRAE